MGNDMEVSLDVEGGRVDDLELLHDVVWWKKRSYPDSLRSRETRGKGVLSVSRKTSMLSDDRDLGEPSPSQRSERGPVEPPKPWGLSRSSRVMI